ncbi:MAG: histidine kinase, partial [Pseudomonadota bacterium]
MITWLKNSLIARGGVAMASIAVIALLNIFASVIVADKTQGDAAAINVAGSLRMQSYKLAYLLQQANSQVSLHRIQQEAALLSGRLHSNELERLLQTHRADALSAQHDIITSNWHRQIEPMFYDSTLTRERLRDQYDQQVAGFVNDIDTMVRQLQQDSESKIRLLMAIQGASMFLTVIVVFVSMYNLNTSIVIPLRRLLRAAKRVQHGDLQVSLQHDLDDELGQLADAFNQMALELSRMYGDLERKVEEKTAALQRSNQSLQLMYAASRKLAITPYSASTLGEIIDDLVRTTGVEHVSLCLNENDQRNRFIPLFFSEHEKDKRCMNSSCDECYMHSVRQANFGIDIRDSSFPIRQNRSRFGILFVETRPGEHLAQWQIELFNAVSDTIATALSLEKKAENENRLMLAEERAAIARELHDSLAQSLSYLKFQIGRWKMLQSKAASENQLDEVVEDIRDGLNGAYKQLRELLTTFRLKVDEPGLEPALKGTIAEFSQRGELEIQLDYGLREFRLTPNEEIHLLQIIRES